MIPLRFTGVIKIRDGNPYLHVSKLRAARLKPGWRKPLPVLVRINGKPKAAWRINLMPIGDGGFYLYLHGDGDRVDVETSFDEAYRGGPMHPMPSWFRAALRQNLRARTGWQALIPSRQKEILRYFSWLKSPEARTRNLERALHVLSGKTGRFMARSWNE
jgi:hypothetical protein